MVITVKPPLSGPPIKRTPSTKWVPKLTSDISLCNEPYSADTSIKQTLSSVPKLTSYISLYNKPLFIGHLY